MRHNNNNNASDTVVDFCVKYNMYNNFDKKGAGKLVIQKITKTKLLVLRKMTSFSNPKKQRSEPYYESSVCTKKKLQTYRWKG